MAKFPLLKVMGHRTHFPTTMRPGLGFLSGTRCIARKPTPFGRVALQEALPKKVGHRDEGNFSGMPLFRTGGGPKSAGALVHRQRGPHHDSLPCTSSNFPLDEHGAQSNPLLVQSGLHLKEYFACGTGNQQALPHGSGFLFRAPLLVAAVKGTRRSQPFWDLAPRSPPHFRGPSPAESTALGVPGWRSPTPGRRHWPWCTAWPAAPWRWMWWPPAPRPAPRSQRNSRGRVGRVEGGLGGLCGKRGGGGNWRLGGLFAAKNPKNDSSKGRWLYNRPKVSTKRGKLDT